MKIWVPCVSPELVALNAIARTLTSDFRELSELAETASPPPAEAAPPLHKPYYSPSPPFVPPKSVLLGASTPAKVQPGEEFTVRFVAYLQEFESQVDRILKGLSPRSKSHLGIERVSGKKVYK